MCVGSKTDHKVDIEVCVLVWVCVCVFNSITVASDMCAIVVCELRTIEYASG